MQCTTAFQKCRVETPFKNLKSKETIGGVASGDANGEYVFSPSQSSKRRRLRVRQEMEEET